MNRLFFIRMAAILSAALLFAGCDKEEQTVDPTADLVQTCWQGTWSAKEAAHEVQLFFETATSGTCVIDGELSGIHYSHDNRIIRISHNFPQTVMISGAWWIDRRTPTEMRLLAYPMASDYLDNTITLQRVYDN